VAEVVAAHGGTVTVGDAHPGAVFTVRLPLAPAQLVSASP
jgi:signal transduction histidine kinase